MHKSYSSKIKIASVVAYMTVVFNTLSGFLYTPWMIQKIGSSQYGLYTLALSVISIFMMDFGLGSAVSKFLSKYYAEGDQEGASNFLGVTYKLYLILTAVIFTALAIFYFFIDSVSAKLTADEIATYKNLYLIVGGYSIISMPFQSLNGILLSNEKYVQIKVCTLLQKITTVALIIFCLLMGFGVYALVMVNAFSSLLFIAVKLILIKTQIKVRINFRCFDKKIIKAILGLSVWITIMGIAQKFVVNMTPTILGMFAGSVAISVYGVAQSLESYFSTLAESIDGMFMPRITNIITNEKDSRDRSELLNLMIKVGRLQTYVLLLVFVGFIVVGRDFMYAWMGPEYSSVYECAVLLLFPGLLYYPQQIGRTAVIVCDKVKYRAMIYIAIIFINLAVSIPMTIGFGVLGACGAICIVYVIRAVAMSVLYQKSIHIRMPVFYKRVYLPMLIPAAVTGVAGTLISYFIPLKNTWSAVIVKGGLVICIYGLLMILFVFNDFEKNLFFGKLIKKFKKTTNGGLKR